MIGYECSKGIYKIRILKLKRHEILSFGIAARNPGNLSEIFFGAVKDQYIINHFEIFYDDVIEGEKSYLTFDGKNYIFPEVNMLPKSKNYQLINGVWVEYGGNV